MELTASPLGDTILSLEDQLDETGDSLMPLVIVREYSAYFHKRQTIGPMGKGWLVKLWYIGANIIKPTHFTNTFYCMHCIMFTIFSVVV